MNKKALEEKVVVGLENVVDKELDLLDNLLNDKSELEKMRNERLKSLINKKEKAQIYRSKGHGDYKELVDEKEFFNIGQDEEKLIIHFYKNDSMRCKILDMHLKKLSEKHLETRICKLNVERFIPLCQKLSCNVIPTIFCFKKGQIVKRIVGFDAFGGIDEFPTSAIEDYLTKIDIFEIID